MSAARRRREPWEEHPAINRRLIAWADWVEGQNETLGWNVYTGDSDPRLRVQKRNDVHSNPVYQEVSNMDIDTRRNVETDSAYRDLPTLWQQMIWLFYVERKSGKREIAEATGMDHRYVSTHFRQAFRELSRAIRTRRYCYDSVSEARG